MYRKYFLIATILITTSSLSLVHAERDGERTAKKAMTELLKKKDSHCNSDKYCVESFTRIRKNRIDGLNKTIFSEQEQDEKNKESRVIANERCVVEYSKKLTDVGETPVASNCKGLKAEYKSYVVAKKEADCVVDYSKKLTDVGESVNASHSCNELQAQYVDFKEAECVAEYSGYLIGAGQVPLSSECSELQTEWFDYQRSL